MHFYFPVVLVLVKSIKFLNFADTNKMLIYLKLLLSFVKSLTKLIVVVYFN